MTTNWPDGADPTAPYLCFTPDTDEATAVAIFARRFGQPPEFVAKVADLLRLGPVPEAK